MTLLLICIVLTCLMFVMGALGAIIGLCLGLCVVSKKLTGSRWTFEDLADVFRKPESQLRSELELVAQIAPPDGIQHYHILNERNAWRDLFYKLKSEVRRIQ